jgi:SSS family solute:Na+ symporter
VVKPGITDAIEADRVVQTIITENLPAWFGVFVVIGVIAAAVSTAAVQLMTSSVIVARDMVQGLLKPDATDRQITTWARWSVIGIIILSLGFSVWNAQAMALYLTDVSIPGFAQWAPALVGGLLWKRGTRQGAVASTSVGVIYLVLGLLVTVDGQRPLLFNLHPVVPTLLVNTIVYIVVSKLTPAPSEAIQEQFYDEVDQFLRSES